MKSAQARLMESPVILIKVIRFSLNNSRKVCLRRLKFILEQFFIKDESTFPVLQIQNIKFENIFK